MTTDVQALLLRIDANTELARRELKKMDGDFDNFTKRSEMAAGSAETSFANFAGAATAAKATIIGFVAGIGIEGVISFGRAVLEAADNLDAAAEKAGVGVERYQTLKEALRSLEVEGDKVDGAFGRLTDTLGAVQGGTAAQGVVDALDKMGITSRILNGEITTTDGLLDAIAASAGRFKSEAEFTSAVIDLVGKKIGVDLANAIKDGGAALKQGEQAFRDAGGVVDEAYIKRLADANETVDRFVSNSKSKLLIWSAEVIMAFDRAGEAAGRFLDSSANPLGQSGQLKAPSWLDFLNQEALPADLFGTPGATDAQMDALNKQFPIRSRAAAPAAGRAAPRAAPRAAAGAASRAGRSSAGPAQLTPAQQRDLADVAPGLDTIIAGLPGALVDLDALGAAMERVQGVAVDLSGTPILDDQALRVGVGLLEDASFILSDALLGASSLGDALVDTFARAGAAILQSGLLNLLSGGKQGVSFGDSLKGLGSILGFANGGVPPTNRLSMVGERGPELFVPSVPGTIIPNHMLGGGGGGPPIQNFDLRGAVVTEQLYATMQQLAAQAAVRGAMGGQQLAADDSARRARRRLPG